jgi:hypothetical protein
MSVLNIAIPGRCRFCGCTDVTPCELVFPDGEVVPCCWIDGEKTICSNRVCIAQVPLDELIAIAEGRSLDEIRETRGGLLP